MQLKTKLQLIWVSSELNLKHVASTVSSEFHHIRGTVHCRRTSTHTQKHTHTLNIQKTSSNTHSSHRHTEKHPLAVSLGHVSHISQLVLTTSSRQLSASEHESSHVLLIIFLVNQWFLLLLNWQAISDHHPSLIDHQIHSSMSRTADTWQSHDKETTISRASRTEPCWKWERTKAKHHLTCSAPPTSRGVHWSQWSGLWFLNTD